MTSFTHRFLQLRASARALATLGVVAVAALLATGCGGSTGGSGSQAVDASKGKTIFKQKCAVCHTLKDAGAAGVQGPDLDQLRPDAGTVKFQVQNGGGGMPANLVKGSDLDSVAAYVAKATGAPSGASG